MNMSHIIIFPHEELYRETSKLREITGLFRFTTTNKLHADVYILYAIRQYYFISKANNNHTFHQCKPPSCIHVVSID